MEEQMNRKPGRGREGESNSNNKGPTDCVQQSNGAHSNLVAQPNSTPEQPESQESERGQRGQPWTKEDIDNLSKYIETENYKEISDLTNRLGPLPPVQGPHPDDRQELEGRTPGASIIRPFVDELLAPPHAPPVVQEMPEWMENAPVEDDPVVPYWTDEEWGEIDSGLQEEYKNWRRQKQQGEQEPATPAGEPETEQGAASSGEEAGVTRERFRWMSVAEFVKDRPSVEWHVKDFISKHGRAFIVGKTFSGKTFVALNLAVAICLGRKFAGHFDIPEPRNVGYCTEEGLASLAPRLQAAAHSFGVSVEDLAKRLHILQEVPRLYQPREDIERFIERTKEQQEADAFPLLDILIIDPLQDAEEGADENSGKERGIVKANILRIQRELDCAILIMAHPSKNGNSTMISGHSKLNNAADTVVSIEKKGKGKSAKYTMAREKLKNSGEQWESISFTLASHTIGDEKSAYVQWDNPDKGTTADKDPDKGTTADKDPDKGTTADKDGTVKERVYRTLSEKEGDGLPVKQIGKELDMTSKSKMKQIRNALKELEKEGKAGKRLRDPSKGLSYKNPYRYFRNVGEE